MLGTIIQFVSDQNAWDRTLHEGEMAVWAVLTVIHLIPGYGN